MRTHPKIRLLKNRIEKSKERMSVQRIELLIKKLGFYRLDYRFMDELNDTVTYCEYESVKVWKEKISGNQLAFQSLPMFHSSFHGNNGKCVDFVVVDRHTIVKTGRQYNAVEVITSDGEVFCITGRIPSSFIRQL